MFELPRITIVTPSYNQGNFIEQTIRSVCDQNYPNLEYIIMDGGSTDGSVEIIRRYASRLTHWESHKDNGQADAIYRGFELSTGNILGWLNSDDFLLPGAIRKVADYFLNNKNNIGVVGGSILIDSHGNFIKNRFGIPICNGGMKINQNNLIYLNGGGFAQPASFWKKKEFFESGGFDRKLKFCFDFDMYLRLCNYGKFGHIKDFLACFRIHDLSKTRTMKSIQIKESKLVREKYGSYYKFKPIILLNRMIYRYYYILKNKLFFIKILLNYRKIPYF